MGRFTPRALTDGERAVLERLLSADFKDAAPYRAQLDAVTVVGRCGCGCATIELDVDRRRVEPASFDPNAPFYAVPVEGHGPRGAWILSHVREGYISELEVVPPGNKALKLPPADELRLTLD
jgi:hypothetical protein